MDASADRETLRRALAAPGTALPPRPRDDVGSPPAGLGEDPPDPYHELLLLESNLTVRYPPVALADLLAAHDVSPDDEVRDLLDAVGEGVDL